MIVVKSTKNYKTASKRQKRSIDNAARGPVRTQSPHVIHLSAKNYTRKMKHKKDLREQIAD